MTTEAKQYAQRNRQGSDWFYHDKPATAAVSEKAPEQPSEDEKPVESVDDKPEVEELSLDKTDEAPAANTQSQLIRPKSDSNQWSDLQIYLKIIDGTLIDLEWHSCIEAFYCHADIFIFIDINYLIMMFKICEHLWKTIDTVC
jgi:hypothetical protein